MPCSRRQLRRRSNRRDVREPMQHNLKSYLVFAALVFAASVGVIGVRAAEMPVGFSEAERGMKLIDTGTPSEAWQN